MKIYQNSNGGSGVVRYQVEEDRILIQFVNGTIYSYSIERAGLTHVTKLKELAELGRGLATYISRYAHHLND